MSQETEFPVTKLWNISLSRPYWQYKRTALSIWHEMRLDWRVLTWLPISSNYEEAFKKAKEDIEIFDYTTGVITLVDVDFIVYRNTSLSVKCWSEQIKLKRVRCVAECSYFVRVSQKKSISFCSSSSSKILNKVALARYSPFADSRVSAKPFPIILFIYWL